MEERIEKLGSSKKLKRFHNKKQRSNHKQHLKNMTTSYKDLQEENEDDWYEEFEKEEEWKNMKQ
tara:strand:+ start:50 stop:241 length:192 start_codon:yes stop_codon:yes gene_type:complete